MSWLRVGQVVATQGLDGSVRVRLATDQPEVRFKAGETLFLQAAEETPPVPLKVKSARPHRTGLVVRFAEWQRIESAEPHLGSQLLVPESRKPSLPPDEYYHQDIIGCRVVTTDGVRMGLVHSVQAFPAQDLWVIREEDGEEWMLPYTDAFVKEVDITKKIVTIAWLEGLRG